MNRLRSLLSMRCMLPGYSFHPGHNSRALGTVASLMTIGSSMNGYSHQEKPSKRSKPFREPISRTKKLGREGGGGEKEGFLLSPPPSSIFLFIFCSRSSVRALTRAETFVTQAKKNRFDNREKDLLAQSVVFFCATSKGLTRFR